MARLPRKRPVRGKKPTASPITMLPMPKRRKRAKNPSGRMTYIDPKTGKKIRGRVGPPTIGPAPAKPPKRKRPPRGKVPAPLPQQPIKMRPGPKNPGPPKELPARPPKRRKPRNTFKGQGRGRVGRPTIGPAPARRRNRRKIR